MNMITVLMTVQLTYWRCFGGMQLASWVFIKSYVYFEFEYVPHSYAAIVYLQNRMPR